MSNLIVSLKLERDVTLSIINNFLFFHFLQFNRISCTSVWARERNLIYIFVVCVYVRSLYAIVRNEEIHYFIHTSNIRTHTLDVYPLNYIRTNVHNEFKNLVQRRTLFALLCIKWPF